VVAAVIVLVGCEKTQPRKRTRQLVVVPKQVREGFRFIPILVGSDPCNRLESKSSDVRAVNWVATPPGKLPANMFPANRTSWRKVDDKVGKRFKVPVSRFRSKFKIRKETKLRNERSGTGPSKALLPIRSILAPFHDVLRDIFVFGPDSFAVVSHCFSF
jgi:hypothetical protein